MSTKTTVPATEQPANIRINRANTYRVISRLCYAVESLALPAPQSISFNTTADPVLLVMTFDNADEATQWREWLAAHRDDSVQLGTASGCWRGYRVHLFAPDFIPAGA